jgi:UDP-3-O-[3-hydroxymyristoyl] glucosamine N-acyltransferase
MVRNVKRLAFTKKQRERFAQEAFIHASVHIPQWVKLGENVTIHENCSIGTEGFGFEQDEDGSWLHIPHTGKLIIENDVEIFPHTTVNRGTVEDTVIGAGTKIDHHCHIGHNSIIGRNCIITANVVIAGSVKIGDGVWIGPHSTIMNKVVIGDNVYVGAQTNVISDVEEGVVVVGNPARVLRKRKKSD